MARALMVKLLVVDHSYLTDFLITRIESKFKYLIPIIPKKENYEDNNEFLKAQGFSFGR